MRRFCARCDDHVDAEYEEPGMRKFVKIYFVAGLFYLPFLPIIGADFFVMIPNFALYVFGAGAAMRYWNQPALCTVCGAETERDAPEAPPMVAAASGPYRCE